jgi:hypothetical protein
MSRASGSAPCGIGSLAIARARFQQREEVEADVSDDFDDDLRRELNGGIGQLRGKLDAELFGLLDYAGADVLAEHAEGFADDLWVHVPCGQRLGLEGGPSRWVTGDLAAEDVVEGACRGITLGERFAQIPLLA